MKYQNYKPKFNVRKAIQDKFFEGSYHRVDYAEQFLEQVYKMGSIRRKGKVEDLLKYYDIPFEYDLVGDTVHGHPERMVPAIYIPFKEDIDNGVDIDDVEITDTFLQGLLKDLENKS